MAPSQMLIERAASAGIGRDPGINLLSTDPHRSIIRIAHDESPGDRFRRPERPKLSHYEINQRAMIEPSAMPRFLPALVSLRLGIVVRVVRPVRRLIPFELSADCAAMSPKTSRDFRLVQTVLRQEKNLAALTCAKM